MDALDEEGDDNENWDRALEDGNWDQVFRDERAEYKDGPDCIQGGKVLRAPKDTIHSPSHTRVIVHIDLDCFYAQVEMIREPKLRDKPLGIQQKNIIVTCNYVARSRGLTKLMYLAEAVKKCPDLVVVKGEDLTPYRQMSYSVTQLLSKYSPLVERLGFDENFVDITDLVTSEQWRHVEEEKGEPPGWVYGSDDKELATPVCRCGCDERLRVGAHVAQAMREQLKAELGLTSCGGIGHNKLLAKLVGSTHKPNQQTRLPAHLAQHLLTSLGECRKIPGIGRSMAQRLQTLGVVAVSDLRGQTLESLLPEFGEKTARLLQGLAAGVDDSPVIPYSRPLTMSDEDSFKRCSDSKDAEIRMRDLLKGLLKRVEEDGRVPQTLRVTVRKTTPKWHRESRQCPIPAAVTARMRQGDFEGAAPGLLQLSMDLFHKLVDIHSGFLITLINIAVCKFGDAGPNSQNIARFFRQRPNISAVQKTEHIECVRSGDDKSPPSQKTAAATDDCSKLEGEGRQGQGRESVGAFKAHDQQTELPSQLRQSPYGTRTKGEGKRALSPEAHYEYRQKIHQETCSDGSPGPSASSVSSAQNPKRARLVGESSTTNRQNCQIDRVLAPPGVDPDVFSSLPHSVQLEVVAQYSTKAPGVSSVEGERSVTAQVNRKSPSSIKSFFTKSCQNVKQSVDKGATRADANSSVKEESCTSHERRNGGSNPDGSPSLSGKVEIPPTIDRQVFFGLPPDIQKELMSGWKGQNNPAKASPDANKKGKASGENVKKVSGQRTLDRFFHQE